MSIRIPTVAEIFFFAQLHVYIVGKKFMHFMASTSEYTVNRLYNDICYNRPGGVAQSVGHLTRRSGVLGSIPGLATYFRFSFRFFKKGSCQLLAKVCARSTG